MDISAAKKMTSEKTQRQIGAAEPNISSFFIPCICLSCHNLVPTLPTMQVDFRQLWLEIDVLGVLGLLRLM